MLWFSDKKDLQYYNQTPGAPCYCEELIYPSDMVLQGSIAAGLGTGTYDISIEVWSTDGNTAYEVATSYFDYYFFTNPVTHLHMFTARLRSFSPAMCAHQCFLMRVGVKNSGTSDYVFANWTERWCVSDCCDSAKGIVITQDGIITQPFVIGVPVTLPAGSAKLNSCGEPMLRLISQFDCYDAFTGEYYGQPNDVLSGSFVPFFKISSIKGRIVRRPREIKREISYNCRLQQSESTQQYLLEGFEYFPAWKMVEIENQLHANHIWVDDYTTYKEYSYEGGTPFRQIHKCAELFKLETTLQDCTQRQMFGCGDCNSNVNFDGSLRMFVIPEAYNGGSFYNESKRLVAEDYEELLDYLRAMEGITAVNDVDITALETACGIYKVCSITGTGALPSFFYYDAAIPANKVYGRIITDEEQLCYGPVCRKPETGEVEIEDIVCTAPTAGEPTVADMIAEEALIYSHGHWIVDAETSIALVYKNQVTLSIKSFNETIVALPDEAASIEYEIVGVVNVAARPPLIVILNNTNNETIPPGLIITIDNKGLIRVAREPTSIDSDGATIELENIVYNI